MPKTESREFRKFSCTTSFSGHTCAGSLHENESTIFQRACAGKAGGKALTWRPFLEATRLGQQRNLIQTETRRGLTSNSYKGGTVRKNTVAGLLLAGALALSLMACQDTKARQENEQLKAQVQQLQKENGELGNRVDGLRKENAALRAENERLKARHPKTKTPKPKRRRSISRRTASPQS